MVYTSAPARLPIAAPVTPYRIPWLLRLPYPLRSMLRRWRGMLGMMIGVGIALSLAMTMMAVSKASTDLFSKDFVVSEADLYLVTEGGQMIAVLPGDTPGTIQQARRVLAQTRAIPGLQSAVGVMNWSMERERDGPQRRDGVSELIATMGVDGDPQTIPNMLALDEGRWLRQGNEIVVGGKLAREKGLHVGDTLRLNKRDFTIVGIGKLRGFGFGTDSFAYLDYGSFRDRAGIGDVVNIIAVDTTQPALVRERLPEIGSLSAFSPQELVHKAEEVNASGVIIRWIFSLLALAIGALFVSSMLSRSVVERRLEFATLKAIGIPNMTILLVVAAEAVLVSFVASLLGIGVSLFFGALLNATVAVQYGFESIYSADVVSFLGVFLLALALGVIAGLAPARRATRVDPVDILREA